MADPKTIPGLRIAAHKDGYRRAGLAHTKSPIDHPVSSLKPGQIKALKDDKNLLVSDVDIEVPAPAPKDTAQK